MFSSQTNNFPLLKLMVDVLDKKRVKMGKGLKQTGIDVKTEHIHVHEISHIVTHF